MMSFLQYFQQIQHQYRKQNVFDLLFKCFRKFAFAWFKNQLNFIIIQNFDRDLTCAFFIISFEFTAKTFVSFVLQHSIQFHSCIECFAQFSSMIRFLKHTKQINCSKMICKHCEQNFNFKNKFHEHIREQHIQKSNINSNFRLFTSEFTYKFMKKSISFVSFVSSIFFATSRNYIFYFATIFKSTSLIRFNFSIASHEISSKQTKIATMLITWNFTSKRVEIATFNCSFVSFIFFATFTSIFESILSKCSNFSIATFNITSKSIKKLSVNSFTFSISFFRTSVSKHQKFYFIIDDLIRMFREKFKSFDLRSFQKRRFFSRNFDIFYQSRIIVYFLFAINQKSSISQNLKNSNLKNFQQYTFAKSIRLVFILLEKSIFSLYKMINIFYISLQSKFSLKFSFLRSRFSFA